MRFARKHETKKLSKLFSSFGVSMKKKRVEDMINNKKIVVLREKGKLRGAFWYLTLGISGLLSVLYVRKLVVPPKLRNKGIGSFMLKKIKEFAAKQQAKGFLLRSLKSAERFYKKNKLRHLFARFFWWRKK